MTSVTSIKDVFTSRKKKKSKGGNPRIENIRRNNGEEYPNWRKFESMMTPAIVSICETVEDNGHRVFLLDGDIASHLPVICPSYPQPYPISSTDIRGDMHHDMTVTVTPSRLGIEYADGEQLHARPGYSMFTNGNPNFESNYPGLEELHEIEPENLQTVAPKMLSRGDIIVFFFVAADGVVFGNFVAPKGYAHFVQQFSHMHIVPTYEELEVLQERGLKSNTKFLCAPGLRRSLFQGQQNVTFIPSDDGKEMTIIGSTVYEGGAAKKPFFVTISWFLMQGKGMALHASMAECLKTYVTYVMICDSGRGKTELRKALSDFIDSDGRLLLGFRKQRDGDNLKRLSIPFSKELVSDWLSLGDDGLSIDDVFIASENGLFTAVNWEHGLFDRNSGAYKAKDLPEIDAMVEINDDWTQLRTTNLKVTPGQKKFRHWERTLISGRPCSNPRLSYSNELLGKSLKFLAEEHGHAPVTVVREPRSVSRVFYAFASVKGVNAGGPFQKISNGLGLLYEILGGPDALRNKSKSDARPSSIRGSIETPDVRFSYNGTMGQFNYAELKIQFERIVARHRNSPKVEHFLIQMEEAPKEDEWKDELTTAEKEVEYVPEILLRELLSMQDRKLSQIKWKPSKFFFLGYEPTRVLIGDNEDSGAVNPEFFDPELIHGHSRLEYARNHYAEMCKEMDKLVSHGAVCDSVATLFDFFCNVYGEDRMVIEMSEDETSQVLKDLDELLNGLNLKGLKPQVKIS